MDIIEKIGRFLRLANYNEVGENKDFLDREELKSVRIPAQIINGLLGKKDKIDIFALAEKLNSYRNLKTPNPQEKIYQDLLKYIDDFFEVNNLALKKMGLDAAKIKAEVLACKINPKSKKLIVIWGDQHDQSRVQEEIMQDLEYLISDFDLKNIAFEMAHGEVVSENVTRYSGPFGLGPEVPSIPRYIEKKYGEKVYSFGAEDPLWFRSISKVAMDMPPATYTDISNFVTQERTRWYFDEIANLLRNSPKVNILGAVYGIAHIPFLKHLLDQTEFNYIIFRPQSLPPKSLPEKPEYPTTKEELREDYNIYMQTGRYQMALLNAYKLADKDLMKKAYDQIINSDNTIGVVTAYLLSKEMELYGFSDAKDRAQRLWNLITDKKPTVNLPSQGIPINFITEKELKEVAQKVDQENQEDGYINQKEMPEILKKINDLTKNLDKFFIVNDENIEKLNSLRQLLDLLEAYLNQPSGTQPLNKPATIDAASIRKNIEDLTKFNRKFQTPENDSALNYVAEVMKKYGLATKKIQGINLVAEIPGINPDKEIIIGAHIDSIAKDKDALTCPGANDNASGVAALLEIARVLGQQKPKYTVKLVFFNGEEAGLNGSERFVKSLSDKDKIKLAINIDMIGWTKKEKDQVSFLLSQKVLEDPEIFKALLKTNSGQINFGIPLDPEFSSDEFHFFRQNIPVIGIHENPSLKEEYPYYNTSGDTVDKLNFDYLNQNIETIENFLLNILF